MNRNILLLVCACVGVSLLAIHFNHRQTTAPAAALNRVSSEPVNNLPFAADTVPVPEPVTKVVVAESEQDSNTVAVPETALPTLTNVSVAEEKNTVEDKYELLRGLSRWAAKDPEAALAAAMALPAGDERNEALRAVCSGLAQTDPAEAVKLALELRLDKQPAAVMQDLVQQWAATDLISSLTWAENQPAGATRDEFTTRIAFIMSQSDPSDAATLVLNQIPPGPAQDEAIMTVLHQWANQNFADAAGWAKGVIAGPLQDRVLNELNGILEYQRGLKGL